MLIYQIQHYIQPQHVARYIAETLENARLSRKEPGVIRFEVFRNPEDPHHFALIESYIDEAAQAAHLETEHFQRWKALYLDQEIYQRRGDLQTWEYLEPFGPVESDLNAEVRLRKISGETVRAICGLEVREAQRKFVAPNAVSIAEAYFEPKAWFRGIYAGETPVGFVMLYDDPDKPSYYLWRYMIDGRYQGLGYGYAGMQAVLMYVRTRPQATELRTSYLPGQGSPHGFYRKLGFEETGRERRGELEMRIGL